MSKETTLVVALAQMIVDARSDGVPAAVQTSVRQRILDTIGICAAASQLPTSRAVMHFATSQGGAPEAQAVGSPTAIPAILAALVNGTLAHSLDFDDTHLPSVLHPSATVVPTCLAVGELVEASGSELLAAIGAGLEVCVRLGMAGYDENLRNSNYFDRGQHATSICGTVASSGAAASLLGLDVEGIANAMSIAVSMASGVIEANRTGGTVKRIHCGWAAHAAVAAARLAQLGLTGPPTVLEGRFGFFRAFLGGVFNAAAITVGLGEEWVVPSINFKPYPANHFTHAGIDAALALRARGLRASEVVSIRLGVAAPVLHTIGEPIGGKRCPDTGYEAQFSGPYAVVAALLGGGGLGVGLDDFTDELARDPLRRALMAKVDVVEDAECTSVFPEQFAAVLSAETDGGATLLERVMVNRGGIERPLTDDELARKFEDNAGRVLTDPQIRLVQDAVWSLESNGRARSCLEPLARVLAP